VGKRWAAWAALVESARSARESRRVPSRSKRMALKGMAERIKDEGGRMKKRGVYAG
jgi:hypothetical protein